jgi:hypothetical protein
MKFDEESRILMIFPAFNEAFSTYKIIFKLIDLYEAEKQEELRV